MSKPQSYDFSKTSAFLNEEFCLESLAQAIKDALSVLANKTPFISDTKKFMVWGALVACADLLDTIQAK